MRSKLLIFLQIITTVALLAWLVSLVPAQAWENLTTISPLYFMAATASLIACQAIGAFRLQRIFLRTLPQAGFLLIFKSTWLGYFCSSFLPGSIGGDAVKFVWLKRALGQGPAVLAGMVMERAVSFSITLAVALWALAGLSLHLDLTRWAGLRAWLPLFALAGAALALAFLLLTRYARPDRTVRLRGHMRTFWRTLRLWRQSPALTAETAALSLLSLVFAGAGVLAPLCWAVGYEITALQAVWCISLVTVITLVPVTVNGLGVYEAGLTSFLTASGCPLAEAAQAAILMRLVIIAAALPGALWLRPLWRPGRRE
ncbi:MAG: flippase-like domain-containing protein [Candidatus Adiutrix sp.]|jgi:uncharacterized membrane protein YbhN (UPF0104 family)|nr:flippase-like domain-containing protein [Candidatus Adiutrix sp.]